MTTYTFIVHELNIIAGNINVIGSSTFTLDLFDDDSIMGEPGDTGEFASLDGGTPVSYSFLGLGITDIPENMIVIDIGGTLYGFNRDGGNLANGNTKIKLADLDNTPVVPCFVAGSLIKTVRGETPVEELTKGDRVITLDSGIAPVRWIGTKTIWVSEKTAPIRFEKGTIGNDRPLLVSPNHRMLLRCPEADLLFGESEVLVPAKHLTNMRGVARVWPKQVTYVHVLFDNHEIIYANGAMSESFHPGVEALNALETDTREEILDLFPNVLNELHSDFSLARICPKSYEVSVLLDAMH